MLQDINKTSPEGNSYQLIKQHQDFERYLGWKELQNSSAAQILKEGEAYHPVLEARGIDPTKMALLFVNKKLAKEAQGRAAAQILKRAGLDSLAGIEKQLGLKPGFKPRQGVDVRAQAKDSLIKAWHERFLEDPEKSSLMLAFSNRDVKDLNQTARVLLKESGHISGKEFTYTISKRVEDDFEREHIIKEDKSFAKGDRIVFTRNTKSLGVKNGTMGTILDLDKQTVKVRLAEDKEISFAPNLNPYFDQGWAITIHKSQGTTVDQTYLLASYEMTQNLAYVAMTRHREDMQVFGSSLDFWRPSILPEVLSKSGEKLSPGDYLDADSLSKLMQQDDRLLTRICERIGNELEAMGVVSKKVFWRVADHFLGTQREKEIRIALDLSQSGVREEVRAEELLQAKDNASVPQDIIISQNLKASNPATQQSTKPFYEASQVEAALRQTMATFADDILTSIGEPYNSASSSATERRYGKKGHIAVNLKTGAWINYKDDSLSGGPLHMLTKLKRFSFREALDYGAHWAGLAGSSLAVSRLVQESRKPASTEAMTSSSSQTKKAELDDALNDESKTKIAKAQVLWDQGLPLQGTLAERYLKEHRKIEDSLPSDLRYLPSFKNQSSGKYYPCLMSAARNKDGNLTAVQVTFLDPKTADKAAIDTPKKSFGVLKGSAVTLQEDKSSDVLFIAEGVETALSLKEAGIQETIKASLGLSNIKRIIPESQNTHVVICADHDAHDSPAARSFEKSVSALKEKGFNITIIKPDKLNEDFNDVLKNEGPQKIRGIISKALFHNCETEQIQSKGTPISERSQALSFQSSNFANLIQHCEQRLLDFIKNNNKTLTSERAQRISLQAERMATLILHSHDLRGILPPEDEMVNISMRAKYEVGRLPEIQKDLMDEGEENAFRAYRIAERLASIEGRLTYEAMKQGVEPPLHLSYIAKKELERHREQLPHLKEEMKEKYVLSNVAAQHCALDILRYKETHGEVPSAGQIAKMVQISRKVENKDYEHLSPHKDPAEIAFLRRREGDLLFKHGFAYDAFADLNKSHNQVEKALEHIERQIRQECEFMSQKDLSL